MKIVPITSGAEEARSSAMSAVIKKSESLCVVSLFPTRGHVDAVLSTTAAGVVGHCDSELVMSFVYPRFNVGSGEDIFSGILLKPDSFRKRASLFK